MKVTFRPDTHTYTATDENGEQFILPSVTQLLRKHGLSPNFDGVPADVLAKAAERGTIIHEEIERWVKTKGKEVGFTEELQFFIDNCPKGKKTAEVLLYTKDYAGTADLIVNAKAGRDIAIYDHKTGEFHRDAVAWQLSLYAKAYEEMFGKQVNKLYCISYKKNQIIEIPRIPAEKVEALLAAERAGAIYHDTDKDETEIDKATNGALAKLEKVQAFLVQAKTYEEEEKALKAQLLAYMMEHQIKSFESPALKLTVKDASVRKSFDEKAFRTAHPEFDGQFVKETKVKESLVVTVREGE